MAAQPVALDGVDPDAQEDELVAADVVDAGAAVARVAAGFYEPGGAQDRQVFADERLACLQGERGRGAWFVRERPHDPLAQPVAEEVERRQLGGCGPAVGVAFLRADSASGSRPQSRTSVGASPSSNSESQREKPGATCFDVGGGGESRGSPKGSNSCSANGNIALGSNSQPTST